MKLKVRRLSQTAILPKYSHPGDAGLDLYSIEDMELLPRESALIHTGIAIELPEGFEAQVRPRSGLALKHGITVLNSPGTIDQGYGGEIGVILINHGSMPFEIRASTRVAQLVVQPIVFVIVEEVQDLSIRSRGTRGFGSTGTSDTE